MNYEITSLEHVEKTEKSINQYLLERNLNIVPGTVVKSTVEFRNTNDDLIYKNFKDYQKVKRNLIDYSIYLLQGKDTKQAIFKMHQKRISDYNDYLNK